MGCEALFHLDPKSSLLMTNGCLSLIYQKKSPKAQLLVRLTIENYDFLCRIAGELSLAAALNRLIERAKESGITFCTTRNSQGTIRSDSLCPKTQH